MVDGVPGPGTRPVRLPLLVAPAEGEALVGFMARLLERNGATLGAPAPFAASLGIVRAATESAQTHPFDLRPLSVASGICPERLAGMATWPVGRRKVRVGHGILDRRFLRLRNRQVCPECLAADGVHRLAWLIAPVAACPLHRKRLLQRCAKCGEALAWSSGTLRKCGCGARLGAAACDPLSDDVAAGAAALEAIFGLGRAGDAPAGMPPPAVAALPTDAQVDLVVHLGWFASREGPPPRSLALDPGTVGVAEFIAAGATIRAGWPGTFHGLLDGLGGRAVGRPGRFGLRAELGRLAGWIGALPTDGPLRKALELELSAWASAGGPLPTRSPMLRPDVSLVASTRAARSAGIRPERLRAIARSSDLEAYAPLKRGSGAPVLLRVAELRRARAERATLVGAGEAARLLGCGRKLFDGLVASGELRAASGPGAELFGRTGYALGSLDRLVASIGRAASHRREAWPGEVSVPRAMGSLRQAGWPLPTLLDGLRTGAIGPLRFVAGAIGLARLAAEPSVLDVRPLREEAADLSIPETAVRLRLKQEVVYGLCNCGLIRTIADGSVRRRRVNREEVERFEREFFVPSRHSGDRLEAARSLRRLIAAGVRPVTGPTVDGGRQYVFRRLDIQMHLPGAAAIPASAGACLGAILRKTID